MIISEYTVSEVLVSRKEKECPDFVIPELNCKPSKFNLNYFLKILSFSITINEWSCRYFECKKS